MTLTPADLATLRALAPLVPPALVGPDGYPDPSPLGDLPSPAYLFLTALLADRLGVDAWTASLTPAHNRFWWLEECDGKGCGVNLPELPAADRRVYPQTPEMRERRVRALVGWWRVVLAGAR